MAGVGAQTDFWLLENGFLQRSQYYIPFFRKCSIISAMDCGRKLRYSITARHLHRSRKSGLHRMTRMTRSFTLSCGLLCYDTCLITLETGDRYG